LRIFATKPFLPIIHAEGSGYQLGYQVGKQTKSKIRQILKPENIWFSERKELDKQNSSFLDRVLQITEENFPQYIEEIRGYADGAGVDFRDLWIVNSADHQTMQFETCTDVIFKSVDEVILGHNEDFNDINSDPSFFLHMKLDDGTTIFAHTYPGALPGTSFGINSHGIAITCNTLPNPNKNVGVSRKVIDRWLLESRSIDETLSRINYLPRCGVFSYNIAGTNPLRAVNVETTEYAIYLTEVADRFFHTNHYLADEYFHIPVHPSSTSISRYKRLQELVPSAKKTPNDALNILSDSKVKSLSREIYPGWFSRSFATVIYHLTEDEIEMQIIPYSRISSEEILVKIKQNQAEERKMGKIDKPKMKIAV
jgi:isopenicillin-N N-acyltransferase-like protein